MKKRIILIAGFFLCALVIYGRTQAVIGPFLFGDEETYFNLIRNFALQKTLTTSQYGPLYPVVASFLYFPNNVLKSYEAIRFFNLIIFTLSFIPLYLLARRFAKSFTESLLLTLTGVLLPWSAFTALIWAEPLYYFLYCWCWYFAERALRSRQNRDYLWLGFFSALLILAKQLGVAFIAGIVVVRVVAALRTWDQKNTLIRNMLSYAVPFVIPIAFFIWNKLSQPGAGLMGYSNATGAIQGSIFNLIASSQFYMTIFYQISYVFLSSFGLSFLCLLFFAFRWRNISYSEHNFTILILLVTVGISVLISLFFNTLDVSYRIPNEPRLTNGRYLAPLIPVLLIWSYGYIQTYRRSVRHWWVWVSGCLMVASLALFSPLSSVYALGICNSQDTMFLSRAFGEIYPPWNASVPAEWAAKSSLAVAGYFLVLIVILFGASRFRYVYLAALLTIATLNSDVSSRNVRFLGDVTENENRLIKYLIHNQIPLDQVFYDKSIGVDEFKYKFWYGLKEGASWYKSNFTIKPPQEGWLITLKKEVPNPSTQMTFGSFELLHFTNPTGQKE